MLTLTIDGISEQINPENFKTFRNLFDVLTVEMNKEGRQITTIAINDNQLKDNDLYLWLDKPIAELEKLSISSITRSQLIEDQLNGLNEHIETLLTNSTKAAEYFRVGNETESQRYFAAVLEGLRWFNYFMDLISSFLKIDSQKEKIGTELLSQRLAEISTIVNSLADSQESNDWIMLADQLEYELSPVLQKWQKIIPLFKQYI